MDLVPDPDGCDPWADGAAGHSVPGAGQHLQHRHHQHSQGGGSHCYRSLDVGMHPLRVWCFNRVSALSRFPLTLTSIFPVPLGVELSETLIIWEPS